MEAPFVDLQKIRKALSADGLALGISAPFRQIRPQFDIHLFDSLPSTSTQLWNMLGTGYAAGTVAIARKQTAGRGQHGRTWQSDPGGLYLSLAIAPDWPASSSAQLTCLSAWGIATAFNNLGIPLQVKWPNDLFFKGKKLGGILTETKLSYARSEREETAGASDQQLSIPPRIKQAVIGVGINWHNSVPETAITLAKILNGRTYTNAQNKINCLEMLIAIVLRGIMQGCFFHQQVGSQVFMKAYQKLLTQVGNVVSINYGMTPSADSDIGLNIGLVERSRAQSVSTKSIGTRLQNSIKQAANRPTQLAAKMAAVKLARCSGKVIGISEEGYLQVALERNHHTSDKTVVNYTADPSDRILLLKPGEVHIS
ncbi:MAG: biotin--[acetyl-CoA-carboxylase] ligase [Cyanobacteria bacterium J06626_6]